MRGIRSHIYARHHAWYYNLLNSESIVSPVCVTFVKASVASLRPSGIPKKTAPSHLLPSLRRLWHHLAALPASFYNLNVHHTVNAIGYESPRRHHLF